MTGRKQILRTKSLSRVKRRRRRHKKRGREIEGNGRQAGGERKEQVDQEKTRLISLRPQRNVHFSC